MKNAEIKDRIKTAMEIRDIKQSELVEKTGIDKGQLSSYIRGRYKPKQINIQLIADALSVDEAWLMGYDVPMEGEPTLEEIITRQIKKQGTTLKEIAKKANVSYEWLKDIDSFSPSLESQFGEFDLSPGKPLEWDDEIYTRNSYGCISRVAEVLGLPPGMLRAALARQEIPLPEEHNHVSAREAFGFTTTISSPQSVNKSNPLQPTTKEQNMIKQYRTLDSRGKDIVETVLNREAERMKELKNEPLSNITPMRTKPYYQRMASAGSGEYLFDDIPTDQIDVEDTPLSRKADFVLGVNGQSMEPTYNDGDNVLVRKTSDVPIGHIGVFIKGSKCYIKELGEDRLISHNEDKETYPDIYPDDEPIDAIGEVLGKV